MHTHWTKKVCQRQNKNLQGWEKGGHCSVRVPRHGTNWKCSSSLSLFGIGSMSVSLSLWHLCGVGPARSIHSSCVCLSSRPPPPYWHRQSEARKKSRWGQGLPHKTKVPPIQAKPPRTLQIFTPYTHIHTAPFCASLCCSSRCT